MRLKRLFLFFIIFFLFNPNVYALTGEVIGIDPGSSLTFRNGATTSAAGIGSFVNGDRLEILNTNAGLAGCNGGKSPWYQVKYGNKTGYVCSAFVELINENTNNNTNDSTVTNGAAGIDNSYNKDNYSSSLGSDGSVMCYEDTGSITLRDAAGGNKKSGQVVDCGEKVTIIKPSLEYITLLSGFISFIIKNPMAIEITAVIKRYNAEFSIKPIATASGSSNNTPPVKSTLPVVLKIIL